MLDVYCLEVKNRMSLPCKAIRKEVMKQAVGPEVRTFCDDMFFALPMFYFAKSYTSQIDRPMYIYYNGIGYWSPLYSHIGYEQLLLLFELKRQLYAYHSAFLKAHGEVVDYAKLVGSLDVVQHVFDLLKLEDYEQRFSALYEFHRFFSLLPVPAPYSPKFYPPGCEPKRYTYSLKSI